MTASLLKTVLTMGAFVAIGCGWSLLFVPRNSGAFVISVLGIVLGVMVMALSIPFARRAIRRDIKKETAK